MMEVLIPAIMFLFFAAFIPISAFGITSSYNEDGIPMQHYFKRPDAATFFTDTKLISLRAEFEKEYNERKKIAYAYSAVMACIFCVLALLDAQLLILGVDTIVLGFVFGLFYFSTSAFIFGRLGASYGRLQTTKPLTHEQRQRLELLIKKSEAPKALIQFINHNPKTTLAYIDLLNLEFAEKCLIREREDLKIQGLTK